MTINYLAVLVCAAAAMAIGFVWYGPLFGKAWMRIMGSDTMSAEQKASMMKNMWVYYVLQFILSFITAGVLYYHILNWSGPATSVGVAVCSWLGFVMTTNAGAALWSGQPSRVAWKMFFISAGGQLVTFIAFGLIIGAWL